MRRFFKRPVDWSHAHPLVRRLRELQCEQQIAWADLSERSGVARATISSWKREYGPRLTNFEAVLNTLGYELVIREKE